jgi:hypothetical protein
LPTDFISNDRNVKCCSKCREVANAQRKKYCDTHAEQIKEYYEKNAEQIREQKRKYREKNAEQISEKNKKYYEKNADQICEKQREHYEKNAEQICERMKKYYVDQKISNPLHIKFKDMIHHSIQADTKSNRLYDLQDYIEEEFLNYLWNDQTQQCYHCKCVMTLDFSVTTRVPTQISIQRLNNDLPHIKSNCVLACLSCNLKRKELIVQTLDIV